jgi:hypothetical protein
LPLESNLLDKLFFGADLEACCCFPEFCCFCFWPLWDFLSFFFLLELLLELLLDELTLLLLLEEEEEDLLLAFSVFLELFS